MSKSNGLCDRCGSAPRKGKEKFCKECRKHVLRSLREEGYLETGGYGHKGMMRTDDQKELTHETKFGTGH